MKRYFWLTLAFLCACSSEPNAEELRSKSKTEAIALKKGQDQSRIVAIGDLHGDLAQTKRALKLAGLIDDAGAWIGGNSVLVQTGDMVDRGAQSLEVMQLFRALSKDAAAKGGKVVNLLGNHEVMNLQGDWRYVNPEELKTYGTLEARKADYTPGGESYAWLTDLPALAIEGDTLFMHAGLSQELAASDLQTINSEMKKALKATPVNSGSPLLQSEGPVWNRTLVREDEASTCPKIDAILDHFGACRMVVGHTPQKKGIYSRCQGRLLVIDVGLGQSYGGQTAVLEIVNGDARQLAPSDGPIAPSDLPDGYCTIPQKKPQ